jgi:hypothetical protein
MSALLIVAALAAQTTPGTSPASSTDTTPAESKSGVSTYVDVEAGAGYSSNPNLSIVNDEGSAFGRISVHAVHSRVSARTTTLLSAYAEDVSYTNHLGSTQSASLFGRHSAAVSEHVRLFGDVSGAYSENGQLDTRVLQIPVVPPPVPGDIITPPIFIPPSGDFLSVTGRQYSFSGHAGGSFGLSPRDSLSLSSGVDHVLFRNGAARSAYTTIPASLAYDRQLSARTTVGARLTASDTNYDGPASVRLITPQITARVLLSPQITFDGALGVSFARISDGPMVRHTTGVSAQANLCGQGETNRFCGHFSVDEQTATTAGPARSISAGVDYSQRLDANQSLDFSIGVTHYSTPTSVIIGQSFSSATYSHAAAAYSRRFGSRLFGGVNLAARKLTQNGPDPKTDLNASLFIRYRLGDAQ